MVFPGAMLIEIAASQVAGRNPEELALQQKGLTTFGDARARELGATGLTVDFRKGYELGLETARAFLVGSPATANTKF